MNTALNKTGVYFQPLDVVRFICALMVIVGHTYNGISDNTPYATLVHNLGYGVEIFFLLSGFLITYFLIDEKTKTKKINFKLFYLKRVLRIFPLYYLAVALAPVIHKYYQEAEPNYLMQLTFLGNIELINGWIATSVNHLWSICIEEHFYLVWPLLVSLVPLRKLPYAIGFFILLSIGFRCYTFFTLPWGGYNTIYLHTLSRWDTIAIGSILAYAYYFNSFNLKTNFFQRLPIYSIFVAAFILLDYKNWSNLFSTLFSKYIYLAAPILAIGSILFSSDSIIKLKTPGVFHYLGKISYGLYIYHPFVILILVYEFKFEYNLFLLVPVLAGTILVSMVSFHIFELPIIKLRSIFISKKTNLSAVVE